jgi:hypothetical protein
VVVGELIGELFRDGLAPFDHADHTGTVPVRVSEIA